MSRPAIYTSEQILSATAEVAAAHGPAGASVARIARVLRAPTGSIYHRFASRNVLLGEVWLSAVTSFQGEFSARLNADDPASAGLSAARYVPEWVRRHPRDARILLLYRSEDFLEKGWPGPMAARARRLRRQMSDGLRDFCKRLLGRADARNLRIVSFALVEAPLAAVRRHLEAGEKPPRIVDALIDETYRATIGLARGQA